MLVNSIKAATRYNNWRQKDERDVGIVKYQIIHRFSLANLQPKGIPDHSLTVPEVAYFFSDTARGTAGCFPYHFLIEPNGIMHQCLPLSVVGLAAGNLNKYAVQIAVVGDFRKTPPTAPQWYTLTNLCKDLYHFGITDIIGHTDKEGTSEDKNKRCPGNHLVVPAFKMDLKTQITDEYKNVLTRQGVKL